MVGSLTAVSMVRLTVNDAIIAKSTTKSILGMPRLGKMFSTMNGFYTEVIMSTMLVYVVLKYGDIKRSDKGFYWVETYALIRGMIMFLGNNFILYFKSSSTNI